MTATDYSRPRHPAILVAPVITLVAVILMLIAARFYEHLPAQLPDCGFRKWTGLPCLACGGTRSMEALSQGKLGSAFSFHPAFALAVLATPFWLGFAIRKFLAHGSMPTAEEQNRRLRIGVIVAFTLLLLNWSYLIFFLP